jgi:serine/threonine protein kinase
MASLRHPNIVQFMAVSTSPPAVITGTAPQPPQPLLPALVTIRHPFAPLCWVTLAPDNFATPAAAEFCSRGSMLDVLRNAQLVEQAAAALTWVRRLSMALDAAKGMLHLHAHSSPIIHRDLKSPNLLVDSAWRVKVRGWVGGWLLRALSVGRPAEVGRRGVSIIWAVSLPQYSLYIPCMPSLSSCPPPPALAPCPQVCDFNLSRWADEVRVRSSTGGGLLNPRWLAPEVLMGHSATAASDVFSFGVVLWELLTWQLPWDSEGKNAFQVRAQHAVVLVSGLAPDCYMWQMSSSKALKLGPLHGSSCHLLPTC